MHNCVDPLKTGEVVLAVGSLGVPAILQRSGIGPSKHLEKLGIKTIVANDEVGHGVDHIETAVSYELPQKWMTENGKPPYGGPMDWPLLLFQDLDAEDNSDVFSMCHFGISPPPYLRSDVLAAVNVTQPDDTEGFRVLIKSKDPSEQAQVVHSSHDNDFKIMSKGVEKTIQLFEVLKKHSVVGERVLPPENIDLNSKAFDEWIRGNTGTVYHWMSTCKSGVNGSVADNNFRVRNGEDFVKNLRVGSGASLPQISEANPHMTISIFSAILAHKLFNEQIRRHGAEALLPKDVREASEMVFRNHNKVAIKGVDDVKPDLREVARAHAKLFSSQNKNKD